MQLVPGGVHIATSKSGDGHGYGLRNIRQVMEKYNGSFKITHEDGVFTAVVVIGGSPFYAKTL